MTLSQIATHLRYSAITATWPISNFIKEGFKYLSLSVGNVMFLEGKMKKIVELAVPDHTTQLQKMSILFSIRTKTAVSYSSIEKYPKELMSRCW